jgi:[pyruvate, water dikinase]-phosphate phosphotransferase / [pyruvate, water dikinase] kinase
MVSFHLHLLSDATGETVRGVAKACLVQFTDVDTVEHNWPMVRTAAQVARVLQQAKDNPGVVMFTVVDEKLRRAIEGGCREIQMPFIAVLDPVLVSLTALLKTEFRGQPGRQHELNAEYFGRIDAMTFAMEQDDGQSASKLGNADVVLVAVSRSSKTPTCIYLANRGIKAANVPFVPGIPLPRELLDLDIVAGPLVVGLTSEPERLVQIRQNRLRVIGEAGKTSYADLDIVKDEVAAALRIFREHNWPVIDVTRRSIEETASAIFQLLERRRESNG